MASQSQMMVNVPYFGQVQARVKYLASAHYSDLIHRSTDCGFPEYKLKAAKKGVIEVLPVYDSQTIARVAVDPNEEPTMTPVPKPVETIVLALLTMWRGGYIGASAVYPPAVMEIKDSIPSESEKEKLNQMAIDHCRAMVKEADDFYVTKKGTITPNHYKALEWLSDNVQDIDREWYLYAHARNKKRGVASGMLIPMEALQDGMVYLPDFYLDHGLDPMDFGDVFVAEFLKKRSNKTINQVKK